MAANRLEELDLGWNCFACDVFETFGKEVVKHKALRKLHLVSSASATSPNGESPIAWFLESLSGNKTLQKLDISLNYIDFRGALVLEDALEYHKGLSDITISQNPLGVGGMRSFLRLLSRESSGLRRFDCNQCMGEATTSTEKAFNATDPSARYVLDLTSTYSRSVLRMLYKTCERFGLHPDRAFLDLEYTAKAPSAPSPLGSTTEPNSAKKEGKKGSSKKAAKAAPKKAAAPTKDAFGLTYTHPSRRDENGSWPVPQVGFLSATFTISEAISKMFSEDGLAGGGEEQEAKGGSQKKEHRVSWVSQDAILRHASLDPIGSNYMDRYLTLVKFTPSFGKVAPLLAQWQSLKEKAGEQQLLLDALSRDFLLKFSYIHQFCRMRTSVVQVLTKLLPCMTGGPVQKFMALTIPKNLTDFLIVYNSCKDLLLFNSENATGSYDLNLGNPAGYAVAEAIMLLDSWQSVLARKRGLADRSKFGNWTCVRNCFYAHGEIKSVLDWHLPSVDNVKFDFVSWRRPHQDAVTISPAHWDRILRMLFASSCRDKAKLTALLQVSAQFFVKVSQIRDLLNLFALPEHRTDVLVNWWTRIKDVQNMKMLRARVCHKEWNELQRRLGSVSTLGFFQPEQTKFSFDLSLFEDRQAASAILHLGFRERRENFENPSLLQQDGSYFTFTAGVPSSWEHIESLPAAGKLSFSFVCSADDRKMSLRRDLSKKYGGWNVKEGIGKEIIWWSQLDVVPQPVLNFLFYCMKEFKNDAYNAFVAIDGPGGNGQVSFIEMREAVETWGWGKFKSNPDLIRQVFRYLDPDGGGEISLAEWGVMNQLFKELLLSILEFLDFIDRAFVDFDAAWNQLDADGSGGIDEEEWSDAVKSIGFFGESEIIFHYLTNDTAADRKRRRSITHAKHHIEGQITHSAWEKLEDLWRDRFSIRQKIMQCG
jgi:hypothetical protein